MLNLKSPNPGEVKVCISDDAIHCYGKCQTCEHCMDYTLRLHPNVKAQMSEVEWVREAVRRMNARHDCPAIPVLPWGGSIDDFLKFGATLEPKPGPLKNNASIHIPEIKPSLGLLSKAKNWCMERWNAL